MTSKAFGTASSHVIDYDNLPEDPQQAFLVIERVLRQELLDDRILLTGPK